MIYNIVLQILQDEVEHEDDLQAVREEMVHMLSLHGQCQVLSVALRAAGESGRISPALPGPVSGEWHSQRAPPVHRERGPARV